MNDEERQAAISALLPNTFPFPNWVIDTGIWSALGGMEAKCYAVFFRKTLGWWKHEDAIALSQIASGAGISEGTARKAMQGLTRLNLVILVQGNDPKKNYGNTYRYQADENSVRLDLVKKRIADKDATNKKRIASARKALAKKTATLSDNSPSVGQNHPPSVGQNDRPSVGQGTQKPLSKTTKKPSNKRGKKNAAPLSWDDEKFLPFKQYAEIFVRTFPSFKGRDKHKATFIHWCYGTKADNKEWRAGFADFVEAGIAPDDFAEICLKHKADGLFVNMPHSLWYAVENYKEQQASRDTGSQALTYEEELAQRQNA